MRQADIFVECLVKADANVRVGNPAHIVNSQDTPQNSAIFSGSPSGIDREIWNRDAMLPMLRRRPSRFIVALLCALVLSRAPVYAFAEDTISSVVKLEAHVVVAALAADLTATFVWEPALAFPKPMPRPSDAPETCSIDQSVLRL
jgi:hypothetical protein